MKVNACWLHEDVSVEREVGTVNQSVTMESLAIMSQPKNGQLYLNTANQQKKFRAECNEEISLSSDDKELCTPLKKRLRQCTSKTVNSVEQRDIVHIEHIQGMEILDNCMSANYFSHFDSEKIMLGKETN